ncbi:MAG: hypothetical protein JAY74_08770 [Candidatus Thiodiazotropha taylori]|nr:hypothetical protein [Candidatus Thiodiazotropha taylori]
MKSVPAALIVEERVVNEFSSVKSLDEILLLQKQMLDQAIKFNHIFDIPDIVVTFMDKAINLGPIEQAMEMSNGLFLQRHMDKIILAPSFEDIINNMPHHAIPEGARTLVEYVFRAAGNTRGYRGKAIDRYVERQFEAIRKAIGHNGYKTIPLDQIHEDKNRQNILSSVLADIQLHVAGRNKVQAISFTLIVDTLKLPTANPYYKVAGSRIRVPRYEISPDDIYPFKHTMMSTDGIDKVKANLADVLTDAAYLWRGELCRVHERLYLDGGWDVKVVSSSNTCPEYPTFKILCVR